MFSHSSSNAAMLVCWLAIYYFTVLHIEIIFHQENIPAGAGIKFVRQYAPNMRRKTEMKPQEEGAGRRRFVRRRGKGLAQVQGF